MIAASPNCRSRSTSSVRCLPCAAAAAQPRGSSRRRTCPSRPSARTRSRCGRARLRAPGGVRSAPPSRSRRTQPPARAAASRRRRCRRRAPTARARSTGGGRENHRRRAVLAKRGELRAGLRRGIVHEHEHLSRCPCACAGRHQLEALDPAQVGLDGRCGLAVADEAYAKGGLICHLCPGAASPRSSERCRASVACVDGRRSSDQSAFFSSQKRR